MRAPTLKSIADKVGLSPSVVSRVLNGRLGKTGVSAENIRRIHKVAGQLGYVPNPLALGLRSGSSTNIGLILTSTDNPFFTGMLHTFEETAYTHNHTILFNVSRNQAEKELECVQRMLRCYAAGVIVNPWSKTSQRLIQELVDKQRTRVPIVFISQTAAIGNYIRCDLVASFAQAAKALIERGYTKIGYFGPNEGEASRAVNLFRVLAEAGLTDDLWIPLHLKVADGLFGSAYKSMSQFLKGAQPLAEVYLVYSDLVAMGMFRALTEKGLRVPEDVAIVTTDNSILATTNSVPLSSLAYPVEEIAHLSMEAVIANRPIQETLVAPVIWRASTR